MGSNRGGGTAPAALAAAVLVALALPALGAAHGGFSTCDGGAPPQPGTVIDANLLVPAGAVCSLSGVEVRGRVLVEGTLSGFGNTFDRSVVVDGGRVAFPLCQSVLCGRLPGPNHVRGSLIVRDPSGPVVITANVDRNLVVEGAAEGVNVSYATVGGSLSVAGSANVLLFDLGVPGSPGVGGNVDLRGDTGPTSVSGVVIGGTLGCFGNAPAPALAGVTAAAVGGQCSLGV